MQVILATWNAHKVDEIREILADAPFTVVCLADLPPIPEAPETGDTFADNALQKARFVAERTEGVVVADDSGLEVDALAGLPGVRSARFAGDFATDSENLSKLLKDMQQVPSGQRTARFRTVAVVVFPDGKELIAHGVVEGSISEEPRGTGGFGYDSIFVPDEGGGSTFAEMPAEQKNLISHRGRAFRSLAQMLNQ